jgi:NADPH:quinone reductase-like Zn-dependent oxidoreductase
VKAIVQSGYGAPDRVLSLRDVAVPAVSDEEVLVRVRAASVHPDVWHVVTGVPYVLRVMGAGVRRPKNPIPGTDLAGQVEAAGSAVTRFRPGDEVFGESINFSQWTNGGAYAEWAAVPQDRLVLKPGAVTFEQAAAVPTSALIALRGLRNEGRIRAGHRVLINGAGGGLGTFAVQIAKAFGADVTAVDRTEKLGMLRSIGADRVVDYTLEDFTGRGERYDLILDIPGNRSVRDLTRALTPSGRYVFIGHDHFGRFGRQWLGSIPHAVRLMALSYFVEQLPKPDFSSPSKQESLTVLRDLIEAGRLTPVVDRTFPLSEVPAALHYLAGGLARGKVVITM